MTKEAVGRRGTSLRMLLVLLVLAIGAVLWFASRRAEVHVLNQLAFPVRMTIGSDTLVLAADSSMARTVGGPVMVRWEMIRPTTRSGAPVGSALNGAARLGPSDGDDALVLRPRNGNTAFFAPLITNATGVPLTVTVNYGLAGAMPCPCEVPAGAVRMPVGYYALFANSTVRVEDRSGRSATFPDLGSHVNPIDGSVGLRFEAGDLR